ncbi:MAG: hypothetical protein HUU38_17645 [Anaerolineales bacterium]|nr:hypothetical protein [Anaerolineales bacterium]
MFKKLFSSSHFSEGYDYLSNRGAAIFLISVLGLFFEMLFIRWIGTEVRIFAYLQNTILVACFLGLGLGSFTCRQPIRLRQTLWPVFILLALLAFPVTRQIVSSISELLSVLGDLVIWNSIIFTDPAVILLSIVLGLTMTFGLIVLIVDAFVPMGRFLGRLMDDHPHTLWAYSVNVAGSLVGTWLFVLLSYFYQPPLMWFLVFAGLMAVFVLWMRQERGVNLTILAVCVGLAWFAGRVPNALDVVWSPYQKLVLREANFQEEVGEFVITVNNVGYQALIDLRDATVNADPMRYDPVWRGYSQYDFPLRLHPDPKSFLIVGAGAGNDAAGGLRQGVEHIVAVEIDPAIIELGQANHPETPYDDSRVEIVKDDARSFFATTTEKFDVIAFGLLDSHTTTAMTNARLDHYVYTLESLAQAKSLLTDGGIMVLTFEAQKPYIADRMAAALTEVFGEAPLVLRFPTNAYGWGGVMFIAGDLAHVQAQLQADAELSTFFSFLQKTYPVTLSPTTSITTDDWPYIYLETPRIPTLYFLLIGLMGLVLVWSYRKWQAFGLIGSWKREHWHFFFLGAAFLLLEVQNISKASVVLGNTWEVNAVIVSGVLAMVLLANALVYKFPQFPTQWAYFALVAICAGLYFLDLAQFAFLPYPIKALLVGGLTSLPMLFSGIVFIRSFAAVASKHNALGANLLGSLVGALMQSITFVVGIKALLILVAGFYLVSLFTRPKMKLEPGN